MTDDPAAAVEGADLVVIATPLSAYAGIGRADRAGADSRARSSPMSARSRQAVIRDLAPPAATGVHFVPGHPVAGTEHSGPEVGLRRAVPRPLVHPDAAAGRPIPRRVAKVDADCGSWPACGSSTMTADHHDKVLAMTSHLPHLIAYTIVGTATDLEEI